MRKLLTLKPRVGMANLSVGTTTEPIGTKRMRGGNLQRRNRKMFMRNPLCVMCAAQGRTQEAQVWDHKVPLCEGGPDTEANLQGLCVPCHNKKSNADAERRARY